MKKPPSRILVLIAVLKLFKASVLIVVGIAGLLFSPEKLSGIANRALAVLHPGAQVAHRTLDWLAGLGSHTAKEFAMFIVLYAALFTVEGVGLLYGRRWAEWLSIVATGSFVPFEIYEFVSYGGIGKASILVLNVAIVVYLVSRRLRERLATSRPTVR
jgi:uncharacterized membrane protein (DUF2068 family)